MTRTQSYAYRGMTLLEIAVAVTIFAMIIAIAFSVTMTSVRSFDESIANSYIQTKGEKALKIMTEEIGDAYALEPISVVDDGITLYGAQINYRVPIKYGSPNLVKPGANYNRVLPAGLPVFREQVVNPTMPGDFYLTLDFGWREDRSTVVNLDGGASVPLQGPGLRVSLPPDGVALSSGLTPNGHMAFRFVRNVNSTLGENGIFDEVAEDIDIDNDGMKNKRYVVGYLERCIFLDNDRNAATGSLGSEALWQPSRMPMADSNILQPIDNSLTGDPEQLKTNRIFVKNGSRLDVNLYLASVGTKGLTRVVKCSTSIFLRNN